MRILVVSQYFWPENFRINDLVASFIERGHKVTILTGKPNYPEGEIFKDFKKNPKKYNHYNGAKVVRVPLITRGGGGIKLIANYFSFALLASILGPFKLLGQKFDVIFVYEPSPVTVGLPAIVLKYIKKAPVAFWVLDLWPETLKAIGVIKSKVAINMIGVLVSFIYNRCDLLLAQSRSFVTYIHRHCKEVEKIKYFPSWAEDIFLNSTKSGSTDIPASKSGMFTIVFAGNIGDAQDFPSILDAADILKEHQNIRWLIVGDGRVSSWVKGECKRRGLNDKVIMVGRHPIEKMPSFYESADALLVSLKNEDIFNITIPGKVQSYLAAAKPIIGMLNGEGANVIDESGAGYACEAGNAKALANNVLKMASLSIQQRLKLGESGHRYYKKEFDRNTLISRLEVLLETII